MKNIAAPSRGHPSRLPFITGAAVAALVLIGGVFLLHRRAQPEHRPAVASSPRWHEARVRTEPAGIPVRLDDEPLSGNVVRFRSKEPRSVLSASEGCRGAEHRLDPSDAGTEIVLVMDPSRVEVVAGAERPGARVRLNGVEAGTSPARLSLDLCRENRVELVAEGFRPARVTMPRATTPLEARTAVAGLDMEPLARGRLLLPDLKQPVSFYVDGKPARRTKEGIELTEGPHEVRAVSEKLWIDVRTSVDVPAGGLVTPQLEMPPVASIAVQAFPSNCKVYVRKSGEPWRYMDDTPTNLRVAAGSYRVRVEFPARRQVREREVHLRPGENPPLRFSFSASG